MTQRLVGTASMRSMAFLQVDRCSNEPFSTYCVFYKLTSANIAYIAYIALRILRNFALRCVAYFTTSPAEGRLSLRHNIINFRILFSIS